MGFGSNIIHLVGLLATLVGAVVLMAAVLSDWLRGASPTIPNVKPRSLPEHHRCA